jgi:hypothetical protein
VLGSLEELKTDDLWIGELQVSDIREIEWNTTALENLVLGESEKRLLTAIVASGMTPQHASFDDFIQCEQKLIMLIKLIMNIHN